jgi:hypothetical protein
VLPHECGEDMGGANYEGIRESGSERKGARNSRSGIHAKSRQPNAQDAIVASWIDGVRNQISIGDSLVSHAFPLVCVMCARHVCSPGLDESSPPTSESSQFRRRHSRTLVESDHENISSRC